MRQVCPCPIAKVNPANANLKATYGCRPLAFNPIEACGTPCGGNANLKALAELCDDIYVEDPFGTQCVKSLVEQMACPPTVCEVFPLGTQCKELVNSLADCSIVKDKCARQKAAAAAAAADAAANPCYPRRRVLPDTSDPRCLVSRNRAAANPPVMQVNPLKVKAKSVGEDIQKKSKASSKSKKHRSHRVYVLSAPANVVRQNKNCKNCGKR